MNDDLHGRESMFNKKTEQGGTTGSTQPETGPDPTPQPTPSHSGGSSSGGASTVLAEGSTFQGKANVSGTFRVEGRAEGDILASDCLVVGKTGDVEAKVATRRAVLNGTFNGKIEAKDRVELQSGGHVQADIKAKNMVMEDGVQFRGNCQVGG